MYIDLLLILTLALWLGVCNASPLGTLFYSAAERSAIVSRRSGESSAPTSHSVSVSGIVRRQGGLSTVWLNDEALNLKPYSNNEVLIEGQRVRVGETLDTSTQRLTDVLPAGAVTRKGRP